MVKSPADNLHFLHFYCSASYLAGHYSGLFGKSLCFVGFDVSSCIFPWFLLAMRKAWQKIRISDYKALTPHTELPLYSMLVSHA